MSRKHATEQLSPDAAGIARAAEILSRGGLVAVPTETVYGLAARADTAEAVARIYAAKGRPSFNPLIVHVRGIEQAEDLAHFSARARDLATRFWPGPLTLVLPMREVSGGAGVASAVSAGLPTIALRQPAHTATAALLGQLDFPLAAPSANRSEEVSPTKPEHVMASLGDAIDAIVCDGPTSAGLESTIVALREDGSWTLLRPGPITREALGAVLGTETAPQDNRVEASPIESPGQLARHYSPGKPVRLNAKKVAPDEFWIGFGAIEGDCNLSPSGDLNEAAARLYDCLHQGAAAQAAKIAVAPVPMGAVGQAINDRLRRAATK